MSDVLLLLLLLVVVEIQGLFVAVVENGLFISHLSLQKSRLINEKIFNSKQQGYDNNNSEQE